MTTTKNAEKVTLDLDERIAEPSTAKVVLEIGEAGNGWAVTEFSAYVSADQDDQTVWLNLSNHTYASLGSEQLSTNTEILSHRMTRAEAEALHAALSNELAKL